MRVALPRLPWPVPLIDRCYLCGQVQDEPLTSLVGARVGGAILVVEGLQHQVLIVLSRHTHTHTLHVYCHRCPQARPVRQSGTGQSELGYGNLGAQ